MYLFECEATFEAEPAAVWAVWTDVDRWPEWDVSKEIARLDGPLEPGVSGWAKQRGNLGGSFTITEVEAGRRWVTECPMPLGKVVLTTRTRPPATGSSGQEGLGAGRIRAPGPAVRPHDAPRYRRVAGRPGTTGRRRGTPWPGKPR